MMVSCASMEAYSSLRSHIGSSYEDAVKWIVDSRNKLMSLTFPYLSFNIGDDHEEVKPQSYDELFDELDEISKNKSMSDEKGVVEQEGD